MRPRFMPDWIIIGARATSMGVEVYASVTVSDGECIARSKNEKVAVPREFTTQVGQMVQQYAPDGYDVSVHVDRFITVQARDYAEALRILGALWQPPHPDGPAEIEP